MAFIPWPDGVQLCFLFNTAGQAWQFCLALRKSSGSPTPTDLQTVADTAMSWAGAHLLGNIENDTTLLATQATDMTSQGAPTRYNTTSAVGGITGTYLPLNAALCVSGRTEKRGRSYRGRTYISGSPASALISDVDFSSSQVTNLLAAMLELQNDLGAQNFDVVIASERHNKADRATAELNEVVAWVADQHIDSQRRRLAGRGS